MSDQHQYWLDIKLYGPIYMYTLAIDCVWKYCVHSDSIS